MRHNTIQSLLIKKFSEFNVMPLCALAFALAGCAGRGAPPTQLQTPTPIAVAPPLTITTTSLPGGSFGQFFSATLQASGGTAPYTWSAQQDTFSDGLALDSKSGALNGVLTTDASIPLTIQVQDALMHSAIQNLNLTVSAAPIKILTTALPNAVLKHAYDVSLITNRLTSPAVFSLQSAASSLPPGITLNSGGELQGTPTTAGTFTFKVQAQDPAPGGASDARSFMLTIIPTIFRNDAIANATSLSNGRWHASISPYADPVLSVANPDTDFYHLRANGGDVVRVEIFADRLQNPSPLDSVIEILDSTGQRLATCNQPGETAFTSPCMNNNIDIEGSLDSMLSLKVPGSAPVDLFVHVLDWRGDARPDMLYDISILGAQ